MPRDLIKKREYDRKYWREVHYPKKKKHYANKATKRRYDIADKLARYKKKHGCYRCGYDKCAQALDFDHVRGHKEFAVSEAILHGYSWVRILAEIAKCNIVCANCHRELTHQRRRRKFPRRKFDAPSFNG